MKQYLLVGFGGALGSMLRYFMGASLGGRLGVRLPFGTFIINVCACFLIGLTVEYLGHHVGVNPAWRFLIPVGFIGGFSTFSTFEWEAWASISSGAFWIALGYIVLSVVAGLIAVAAGTATARTIA